MAKIVFNIEQTIEGKSICVTFDDEGTLKTILVSDLPDEVTESSVHIHFQKKKNGGGEVEKVEMLGEGKARVVFEKPEGSSDYWLSL